MDRLQQAMRDMDPDEQATFAAGVTAGLRLAYTAVYDVRLLAASDGSVSQEATAMLAAINDSERAARRSMQAAQYL